MHEDLIQLSTHPHDAFAKHVFLDTTRAAHFFQGHLSPEISAHIDWSTLVVESSSFIRRDLQQNQSDILYSVRLRGQLLKLYLLFEHQSTPDQLMALRLMIYLVLLLEKLAEQDGLPLPPVIAFVLHQGPDRWTVSQTTEDLFDLDEGLGRLLLPYLPKMKYALLDLTQYHPDSQERDKQMRLILQLMKMAREQRMEEFFDWLGKEPEVMRLLPEGILEMFLVYALHVNKELDVERVAHKLHRNPELENKAMSLAEQLIEKGIEKGLWAGKLAMLQQLMGKPVSTTAELKDLTAVQLEARFHELEAEYKSQFKS